MRRIVAASILSADFTHLADEIAGVAKAGADWLHIDVMDGHFVENLTIGPFVIEQIAGITDLPLDVHLMIEEPNRWIERYAACGAYNITVHVEACRHLHRTIHAIKEQGVKASVSLNPATPPELLDYILPDVDMVLVMSVNPGFGGQSYISTVEDKIVYLDEVRKRRGYNYLIEVDGGVNPDNAGKLRKLGVDVFVAGSAIFKSDDYAKTIQLIRGEK